MKTTRRNFFGKLGMAIAAMAAGFVAANKIPSQNIAVDCQEVDKIIENEWSEYMLRHTSFCYKKLSGDFQNLGLTAEKMAA